MVKLARPLKRAPASDAEILKLARDVIKDGQDRFICLAIERVGRSHGSPSQIANLIDRVRTSIRPYLYYSQWARVNKPTIFACAATPDVAVKQGRLELIDRLITEVQHGPT